MSRARSPSTHEQGQLHVAEVAELLRVSVKTLRRWDRDGSLPASRDSRSGHRIYARGAVAAFAARRQGRALPLPALRAATLHQVSRALDAHGVLVLAGPPGVGKTWMADLVAHGYATVVRARPPDLRATLDLPSTGCLVVVDAVSLETLHGSLRDVERLRAAHPDAHFVLCAGVGSSASIGVVHVLLEPLVRSDAMAMLSALAGRALSHAWTAPLVAALEGHPPWLRRAGALLAERSFEDPLELAELVKALPDPSASTALDGTPEALTRALSILASSPRPLTLEMAVQLVGEPRLEVQRVLDDLERRALLVREGAFFRAPEPVRLAVLARSPSSDRLAHQRASDVLLVEQLEARRAHVTHDDVDLLLDVVERGALTTLAERALRAIPGWAVHARHLHRAAELGLESSDPRFRVETAIARGELELALACAREARRAGGADHELRLREAFVLRRLGRLDEAQETLDRLLAEEPLPELRARMWNELGAILYLRGLVERSVRVLLDAESVATDLGLSTLRGAISTNLANALADRGDLRAASEAASRARFLAGDGRGRAIAAANFARLRIDLGDLDTARATLEALDEEYPQAEAGLRSFVLRLRGWIHAERGEVDAASDAFAASSGIAVAAGERHAARRAEIEAAIAIMAERPEHARRTLARLEGEARRDPGRAAGLDLVRALSGALGVGRAEAPPPEPSSVASVDDVTARLAALAMPGAEPAAYLAQLRIAGERAMTRAMVRHLRAHVPGSLSLLAIDARNREALVGATRIDLGRKRAAGPVLRALVTVWPGGLEPAELLARGWPDERLSMGRAKHRVHGTVAMLRRLGVPITFVAGQYRLDVESVLDYDLERLGEERTSPP